MKEKRLIVTTVLIDNEPAPGIEAEYQMMQQMLPMIPVQIFNDFAKQILTKENQVLLVSQPQVEGKTLPAREEMLSILNNAMQNMKHTLMK